MILRLLLHLSEYGEPVSHCSDVTDMNVTASQIKGNLILRSTAYSDQQQRKHQKASHYWPFVWGIRRWIYKGPVMRSAFHMMTSWRQCTHRRRSCSRGRGISRRCPSQWSNPHKTAWSRSCWSIARGPGVSGPVPLSSWAAWPLTPGRSTGSSPCPQSLPPCSLSGRWKMKREWLVSYRSLFYLSQNGRHFADDAFERIFLNENVWISIKISVKFFPKGLIINIPELVQIMAWCPTGDKPLSEPMMVRITTHICVTRPQWVTASSESYRPCSLPVAYDIKDVNPSLAKPPLKFLVVRKVPYVSHVADDIFKYVSPK